MSSQLYCAAPGCVDPKTGFPRPVFRDDLCQSHKKQAQRHRKLTPIKERLPLGEQMLEVYGRYAEADSDEDFARLKRELNTLFKKLGAQEFGRLVAKGLARAKAEGRHIGRRPKVHRAEVTHVLEQLTDYPTRVIAEVLRISERTVRRYRRRLSIRTDVGISSAQENPSRGGAATPNSAEHADASKAG